MKIKCCFCGKEIDDVYSNNPEPLMSAPNRCCTECNYSKVLPARFKSLQQPKESEADIYKVKGYESRDDYFQSLADDYGVDLSDVQMLSQILGKSEDFDGLVNAVQDYADDLHEFYGDDEDDSDDYDDLDMFDDDDDEDPDGYFD